MGYNKDVYARVKSEYAQKHSDSIALENRRLNEVHTKIPEIKEIDKILNHTGLDIMKAMVTGGDLDVLHKRNDEYLEKRHKLLEANGYPKDYTDVKYECEKCKDTGYTDDMRMCECMKAALVMASYEVSGINNLLMTQTFESFNLDYYSNDLAVYARMKDNFYDLKGFAENFNDKTYENYILVGGTGLGKTHLSSAVAKVIIDKGYDVLYASAVNMIGDFEKQRFGTDSYGMADDGDTLDRYYNCDLLIIDDLGTEISNQFTISTIYTVINTRMNKRKSTLISTNLMDKELMSKYPDRINSRLFGEYFRKTFEGKDIRIQQKLAKNNK